MMTLSARIQFLKNRNIAETSTKELLSMSEWNSYKRVAFTPAKEVIGKTLEYLNHQIKDSAFHPQYNPQSDKQYAIIQAVLHEDNHMLPVSITANSGTILDWLRAVPAILEPGKLTFFRFTYDEKAKQGSAKWGVEYMNVDKASDEVPGISGGDDPF